MQFPARNNDVYMVDMERVEVLEGPQGTLFGGGAQAGAIRYITNKPKLDETEGDVKASYGCTAGGDPNSNANATINLPLIADTLAVRADVFNDSRGGYITNVPGSPSFPATRHRADGPPRGSDINPVTYTGIRLSASQVQRGLESADAAELSEHAGRRLFPGRTRWPERS